MRITQETTRTKTRGREAFTLIELLGVVGIIAILLGLVLSAIATVQRFSRKTAAQVEVRAIANAWERYFDHYNHWPTNTAISAYLGKFSEKDVYHTYRIDATLGAALEGRIEHDRDAENINPDGVHFIEFSRYYKNKKNDPPIPVNPWYKFGEPDPKDDVSTIGSSYFYYVGFDVNANNRISASAVPGDLHDDLRPAKGGGFPRSVIVWTGNADAWTTAGAKNKNKYIVSWAQ